MKTNAFVFFAEGFEEIEALTIVDVLRRADFHIEMVSVTGNREVTGAHAITIVTDTLIESIQPDTADILILPGGMPGALNLSKHKLLVTMLQKQNSNKKLIAAICAAPFVLGELGILQKKEATCYPGYESKLQGAIVQNKPVVISDNIITGNGPGAALAFSYAIVSKFKGDTIANTLAKQMMVK